jgi:hypothetical protein
VLLDFSSRNSFSGDSIAEVLAKRNQHITSQLCAGCSNIHLPSIQAMEVTIALTELTVARSNRSHLQAADSEGG